MGWEAKKTGWLPEWEYNIPMIMDNHVTILDGLGYFLAISGGFPMR
jgi:hypothetical protein